MWQKQRAVSCSLTEGLVILMHTSFHYGLYITDIRYISYVWYEGWGWEKTKIHHDGLTEKHLQTYSKCLDSSYPVSLNLLRRLYSWFPDCRVQVQVQASNKTFLNSATSLIFQGEREGGAEIEMVVGIVYSWNFHGGWDDTLRNVDSTFRQHYFAQIPLCCQCVCLPLRSTIMPSFHILSLIINLFCKKRNF